MSDLVDLNDLPETWLPETRPDTRPEIWDDFLGAGPIFDVDKFLEDNNVPILGKKVKDGYTIWEIPCVFRPGKKTGECGFDKIRTGLFTPDAITQNVRARDGNKFGKPLILNLMKRQWMVYP